MELWLFSKENGEVTVGAHCCQRLGWSCPQTWKGGGGGGGGGVYSQNDISNQTQCKQPTTQRHATAATEAFSQQKSMHKAK